ncbi:ubiquitin-binding protein cue5 [Penicillium ochrochloron]
MSEEDKTSTPSKPSAAVAPTSPRAESPTTARPLDFDDEPQESGVISTGNNAPSTQQAQQTATETPPAAPPKPPRPMSPREQSVNTLKEAFPTVELQVVKAILNASNWNVERAFNALLGMTDPTAQEDMVPPPKPPRPSQTAAATSTTQRQLEADEQYARQLAEHFNAPGAGRRGPAPGWENDPRYRQPRGSEDSEDKEYNFFEDDLPVIRENFKKGFLETQTKVNSWFGNLKKQLNGDEEEEEGQGRSSQRYEQQTSAFGRPRRSGEMGRRSGDRERYDADPQVLGDDFSALELRDGEVAPPRPPRPGNTNLKKTASPSPGRRVSFQDGPPVEIDNLYDASTPNKRNAPASGKSSKWQPLATVEPSPVAENDPFSLGDSDDEKDTKAKEQTTVPESEQLKKATAEAMSGEIGSSTDDKKTGDSSK